MKFLKEIAIIFGITMVGEILNEWIPLPVPAGVYGLFLLLGLLCAGLVKLEDVSATGNLLLDVMPVMFIPAGVGLLTSWDTLCGILVPIGLITVVTILTVMAATGWVSQIMIRKAGEKQDE